ncbi:hypothetical protein COL940_008176 [Colletotrichum noveboracense]|nr:hypothetical protein COL940_008176 [Colletotrichum noveboracense]
MLINLARQGWALPIQDLVIANLLDPETMAIPTELEKYKRDHRDSSLKSKYFTLPLFRARLDYSILDQLDESLVAVYHLRHFLTTERSKTLILAGRVASTKSKLAGAMEKRLVD